MRDNERVTWAIASLIGFLLTTVWTVYVLFNVHIRPEGWYPLARSDKIFLIIVLLYDLLFTVAVGIRVMHDSIGEQQIYLKLSARYGYGREYDADSAIRKENKRLRALLKGCAL